VPVDCVPLAAFVPDHAPEAMQLPALIDDHVNVAAMPLATSIGLTLSEITGAAGVGTKSVALGLVASLLPPRHAATAATASTSGIVLEKETAPPSDGGELFP
jgi:hypothetical protein